MSDIDATLAERGARYGDFTEHARIAQGLISCMQSETTWRSLSPVHRQALTVIADKIARILSGDPNYTDNWHDIQGYAKLAEDRCMTGVKVSGCRIENRPIAPPSAFKHPATRPLLDAETAF